MRILTKLPDNEEDYVLVEMKGKKAKMRLKELIFLRKLEEALYEIFSKCSPRELVSHTRIGDYPADLIIGPTKALWDAASPHCPGSEDPDKRHGA